MFNLNVQKQRGIGFIEVLITTLVVAFGLLAVASLQTKLMSGSGDSKTRAEALALAEQKIEDVRNQITKAGFTSLTAATSTDSINGTNASFTRAWTVTDITSFLSHFPARKKISVKVSWGNAADEKVNLVTEMAWISPSKTALYASENSGSGAGATPSPRQNASEDVASENVIGTNMAIVGVDGNTAGTAGTDSSLSVENNDGVVITIYQVAPGSHFYTATRDPDNTVLTLIEEGVIAVFLCQNSTCTHIQNHFGGAVLRIKGTVYSTTSNGLSDIKVAWTSSTVNACYNGSITRTPDSGSLQYNSMPYECVFAGNCNATASASRTRTATGANATDPGCFTTSVVSDAQINSRNVGPGGEYGDVGLLGVVDRTGRREEVCFLEDTAPSSTVLVTLSGSRKSLNDDYLLPVTKRFYTTRRIMSNGSVNSQQSEGINQSFDNHNFLIIDRSTSNSSSGSCNQIANVSPTGYGFVLAPRKIIRTFNESASNNNTVASEFIYYGVAGDALVTTGTINSSHTTDLDFYAGYYGSCYIKTDDTAYACAFTPGNLIDITSGSLRIVYDLDFLTGAYTLDLYDSGILLSSSSDTLTSTATIQAGSTTYPNPNTDPQSFGSCSPLPTATCEWINDF